MLANIRLNDIEIETQIRSLYLDGDPVVKKGEDEEVNFAETAEELFNI